MGSSYRFQNRQEAGKKLAEGLKNLNVQSPIVIGLPRGGIPIAAEIAKELHAELDVIVVRKIGAPDNPEFGIGAIAEGGLYWLNDESLEGLGITAQEIQPLLNKELQEVNRRVIEYRNGRPPISVTQRNVILVDDGLATGVTATIAIQFLKQQGAKNIILAVPVCAKDSAEKLSTQVDQVICLQTPNRFFAVGLWYEDFSQLSDQDVALLLSEFSRFKKTNDDIKLRPVQFDSLGIQQEVQIADHSIRLPGYLVVPSNCKGLVLFAHGSGSSRFSPRNIEVANELNQCGIGTLLFDLLSPGESGSRAKVFDIPLLASRLLISTKWIKHQTWFRKLPIGYFGASTGAGAALWAAAELGNEISAIVSRGGRPDLAYPRLEQVLAPTLLIVGGEDEPIIQINEEAADELMNGKIMVIPGATHLFEEPGTLELVSKYAAEWFLKHFEKANTYPIHKETA